MCFIIELKSKKGWRLPTLFLWLLLILFVFSTAARGLPTLSLVTCKRFFLSLEMMSLSKALILQLGFPSLTLSNKASIEALFQKPQYYKE